MSGHSFAYAKSEQTRGKVKVKQTFVKPSCVVTLALPNTSRHHRDVAVTEPGGLARPRECSRAFFSHGATIAASSTLANRCVTSRYVTNVTVTASLALRLQCGWSVDA